MEQQKNINICILIYVILLVFILSDNNEKTAIVSILTICLLLYSNKSIKEISTIIIGIIVVIQLVSLNNVSTFEGLDKRTAIRFPNNIVNYRNSVHALGMNVNTIFNDDDGKDCAKGGKCRSNTGYPIWRNDGMWIGGAYGAISYMHKMYGNFNIQEIDNYESLNALSKKFADQISLNSYNFVNEDLENDHIECKNNVISELNYTPNDDVYNYAKNKHNEICCKLKQIVELVNETSNIIGSSQKYNSNTLCSGKNCREYFTSEGFTSKEGLTTEGFFPGFSMSNNSSSSSGIKYAPQSGWYKLNVRSKDGEFCGFHNHTAISLNNVIGGGLYLEMIDLDNTLYETIKKNAVPPVQTRECRDVRKAVPGKKVCYKPPKRSCTPPRKWRRWPNKWRGRNMRRDCNKYNSKLKDICHTPTTYKTVKECNWVTRNTESISDDTPINLLKRIDYIRTGPGANNFHTPVSAAGSGAAIKRCGWYKHLSLWNYQNNGWKKGTTNFSNDSLWLNPATIVNNLEIMNYAYSRNEINNITRGPTMLHTACRSDAFMDYILFITGTIKFKLDRERSNPWFSIKFETDDYGCVIIHPKSIQHDELHKNLSKSVVIQTSRWLSGRQPSNKLNSRYKTLYTSGGVPIMSATFDNRHNELKLNVLNGKNKYLLNGEEYNITIMYLQHYGGGNLRFRWKTSWQNFSNLNLHDGKYKPYNSKTTIDPAITFNPVTPYANKRNEDFKNWLCGRANQNSWRKKNYDIWMYAAKHTPFDSRSNINFNTYIAAKNVNPDDNIRPEGFKGVKEGAAFDDIRLPCYCVRQGVDVIDKGKCSVTLTNKQVIDTYNRDADWLLNKVKNLREIAYDIKYTTIIQHRSHISRIILKNLMCMILYNDGLLLNKDAVTKASGANNSTQLPVIMSTTQFFTKNQDLAPLDAVFNEEYDYYNMPDPPGRASDPDDIPQHRSDIVAQRLRKLLSNSEYSKELCKILFLLYAKIEFKIENNKSTISSIYSKPWGADVHDRIIIDDPNLIKFYNKNTGKVDEAEFKSWAYNIKFMTDEVKIKNHIGKVCHSYNLNVSITNINYSDSSPTAQINFAGNSYNIPLVDNYCGDFVLENIDSIIDQAKTLIKSSADYEGFRNRNRNRNRREGWKSNSFTTECERLMRDPNSSLAHENCLINEIKFIISRNNIKDTYNIFKQWFCDPTYSPVGPKNYFQDKAVSIKCSPDTKVGDSPKLYCNKFCPISQYAIEYSEGRSDISSEPTSNLRMTIDFVTNYITLYDKVYCFLEALKFANDNNIINGPRGLIALFPLEPNNWSSDDVKGGCGNYVSIEEEMKKFTNNYVSNTSFILRHWASRLFTKQNDANIFLYFNNIDQFQIKEKVKVIKENEREITKIVSQYKIANNQFVPAIIKSCYETNTNTMNPIDSPECGGITNDYALALMPDGSYIPRAKTGEDSYAAIRSTISELNNFNFY